MKRQAEREHGVVIELARPEDVRALLMDPDRQWKDGRSAAELAHSWWEGVPSVVATTLATDGSLTGATCDRIVFEKTSAVPGAGGATRTDLMAYLQGKSGTAVAAVEGKAGESFDRLCRDWLDAGKSPGSPDNRRRRLGELCTIVGCDLTAALALRYQLFVRVAAALGEAKAAATSRALVLVHSFDEAASGSDDFFHFAATIGATVTGFNQLSAPVARGAVTLQLGWARDRARA